MKLILICKNIIQIYNEVTCVKCNIANKIIEPINFLKVTINKTANMEIELNTLFDTEERLDNYKCEICSFFHEKTSFKINYEFKHNDFLIISLLRINNDTKINFNPDNIKISNITWRLCASVLYIPDRINSQNIYEQGSGHYRCQVRNGDQTGWIDISDDQATTSAEINSNNRKTMIILLLAKVKN